MKKIVLLLLLLATIAVTYWYFSPEKSLPWWQNIIVPSLPSQNEPVVLIEDLPDDIKPAFMPNQPVADVEDAVYEDFSSVVDADIYELIPQSSLWWVRRDDDVAYPGKILLEKWTVAVKGGSIIAWVFLFDMQSLSLDTPNEELLMEIKDAGYLDVVQYPQASFVLQEVYADKMSGILTIKWVSKKVTFPSLVIVTENKIRIFSDFSIDKTAWGIVPNSPTLNIYLDLHLERILNKK